MDAVVAALEAQQAELSTLLDTLGEDGWGRPSRCDGWTVADVVLHLAQTNEMAISSALGTYEETMRARTDGMPPTTDVDDGAARMVERERGLPTADLLARWHAGADELRAALVECDPHARVTWVAGTLAARTLATTRLAETWIHTGDVFAAFGGGPPPADRLWHVARLAWRTLPYAFSRAGRSLSGPVAFHLRAPSGASWDFVPDAEPRSSVTGDGAELCLVAARRVERAATALVVDGPDGAAVLELIRTWA